MQMMIAFAVAVALTGFLTVLGIFNRASSKLQLEHSWVGMHVSLAISPAATTDPSGAGQYTGTACMMGRAEAATHALSNSLWLLLAQQWQACLPFASSAHRSQTTGHNVEVTKVCKAAFLPATWLCLPCFK